MLMAGFTTVRDLSAPGFMNVAIRQAFDEGLMVGPRVLAAGMSLTVPGGHGDSYYRPEISVAREGIVNGPDEARRAVREWVKMRVDLIKLLVTGGVMTDGSDVGALQWTPDELAGGDRAGPSARRAGGGPLSRRGRASRRASGPAWTPSSTARCWTRRPSR